MIGKPQTQNVVPMLIKTLQLSPYPLAEVHVRIDRVPTNKIKYHIHRFMRILFLLW